MRRQDIVVTLFYWLGYSRIRNWILRCQRKPAATMVTFHDISPEALKRFEANLRFLKRRTNVVSLDDFFCGRLSSAKTNVVITFDDGYKSWTAHAVPILKELGLPATFFVSSGFIGLSRDDETEFMRSRLYLKLDSGSTTGGLNEDDVRKFVEEGFAVGGHTVNHCNLAEIDDSVQLRYEILEDKVRLERIIGGRIQYFAYPGGSHHNPTIDISELLRECGYLGAVTTESGLNTDKSNQYLLRRELTRASMHGPVFRARVYGNYTAVWFLKKQLGTIVQRFLTRGR